MQIETLALENFRNYVAERVQFAPGVNVVVGRNAQGKSNLLEAVYCLSGSGSPRGPEARLVREDKERAVLHGQFAKLGRALKVDLELQTGRGARALLNGHPVAGTKPLREVVSVVYFGPDDLVLVKGPPDGRRRFLDDLFVKLHPAREAIRREWERVLKQRNALLRSAPRDRSRRGSATDTLQVWDDAFVRAGATLAAERLEVSRLLEPVATKRYEGVAGGGRLELSYESEWVPPEARAVEHLAGALRARLEELRDRELERGVSLAGPQRDDVMIALSSAYPGDGDVTRDARRFASQGDQRTAALALKLAEFDLLFQATDDEPILLLDDIFSELDQSRRAYLAETVRGIEQTVITTAEPLSPDLIAAARVIEVSAGRVSHE